MKIEENISLKPYNSFGLDVRAKQFARFSSADELKEMLSMVRNDRQVPLIIGGGTNVLFTRDIDRLVLKNEIPGIEYLGSDEDHHLLKVGAGELWHRFVMHCVDHGYAGVENLSLIPGNVGASPMQNIGAYGVEVKDVFHELQALHIHDFRIDTFGRDDCRFGYRESVFKSSLKDQYVILNVTFKLLKQPVYHTSYGAIRAELDKMNISALSIRNVSDAVINIRRSKLPDPAVLGNAGSFFKNPSVDTSFFKTLKEKFPSMVGYEVPDHKVKLAAGWMIEQCGWKGYRDGDAGCHSQQSLVLVNYGKATGADILHLSETIMASVKDRFGVTLEREVNVY